MFVFLHREVASYNVATLLNRLSYTALNDGSVNALNFTREILI